MKRLQGLLVVGFALLLVATLGFGLAHAGKGNGNGGGGNGNGGGGGGGGGGEEPNLPSYEITIIGTLGGNDAIACGLNDHGDVVGASNTADGSIAPFVYTKQSGIQNLNDFVDPTSGWTIAVANDIDNSGVIVGIGSFDADGDGAFDGNYAVRFLPVADSDGFGTVEALAPLTSHSAAIAINNDGDVVGIKWEDGYTPFIWSPEGGYDSLGMWFRDGQYELWTYPRDISERDENGHVHLALHSERWSLHYSTSTGTYTQLGLGDGLGVNGFGEVTGNLVGDGNTYEVFAFRYSDLTGMTNLGTLGKRKGCRDSEASDINNYGEIVGYSENGCDTVTPIVYTDEFGMADLASLITNPPSFFLDLPGRINDQGQICGPWIGTELWPDGRPIPTKGPAYLISPVTP